MNQHEWVEECLRRYERDGIVIGDPDEGKWQNAHYPAPNPEGDTTILLLYNDHQVQGLLQSEEYGRCCFWVGDTKEFLLTGPFVKGWFELWDFYEKWKEFGVSQAGLKGGATTRDRGRLQENSVLGGKSRKGCRFWNNGVEQTSSHECPGPGWVLGMLKREPGTNSHVGSRWWNNGVECRLCKECPGPGWVLGSLYTSTLGQRWWNNGIENKMSKECPGPGWVSGMLPKGRIEGV